MYIYTFKVFIFYFYTINFMRVGGVAEPPSNMFGIDQLPSYDLVVAPNMFEGNHFM